MIVLMSRIVTARVVSYLDASGREHLAGQYDAIEPSAASEARLDQAHALASPGASKAAAEAQVEAKLSEYIAAESNQPGPGWPSKVGPPAWMVAIRGS